LSRLRAAEEGLVGLCVMRGQRYVGDSTASKTGMDVRRKADGAYHGIIFRPSFFSFLFLYDQKLKTLVIPVLFYIYEVKYKWALTSPQSIKTLLYIYLLFMVPTLIKTPDTFCP